MTYVERIPFREYTGLFVQRSPRYAVKMAGRPWTTKKKPLPDRPIEAHLRGQYAVASLGRWYPEFAVLDVDDRPRGTVDEIRESLGLDAADSMLFSSESENSYHLFLRPEFREKPPTLRLLNSAFKEFARVRGVEIYPQPGRAVRLPFGPIQRPLDPEYSTLEKWTDKLFWFQKLNAFDISTVRGQQYSFDFALPIRPAIPSVMGEAAELFEHGLQSPGSRHESQFKLIYFFWRRNIDPETTRAAVWEWIRRKHNGFSRTILERPGQVQAEIARQVDHVFGKYEFGRVYPDRTHNSFNGFISEPDLERIVRIARGSLPRMRFLFSLVKYYYPRRFRPFVGIHTDKLIEWASRRTYQKYFGEFEAAGIVSRGSKYSPGRFSKNIRIEWPWKSEGEAVLFDGRAVDTFADSVRLVFRPGDFRGLLEAASVKKDSAYRTIENIWNGHKTSEAENSKANSGDGT